MVDIIDVIFAARLYGNLLSEITTTKGENWRNLEKDTFPGKLKTSVRNYTAFDYDIQEFL